MERETNSKKWNRRGFLRAATTAGTAALGLSLGSNSATAVEVGETDEWTRTEASRIELTDANTAPLITEDPVQISDTQWVWDTWPLRTRDGAIAKINGWQVIISLTASNDLVPGSRHFSASLRYFYSRDGKSWQEGGELFEDPLGEWQWAGSAMYDQTEDKLYQFYTAVDEDGQRLALGKGATLETGPHGVEFTGEQEHAIIGTADGELYQTREQSLDQGIIYAFRDPWYFKHPETGEDLILFEGNTPTGTGPNVPESFNGNVGVMQATNDELTEWELLPPILEAVGTNQQLERPHFVFEDGRWYLFVISHQFTFAPGLNGPDALYGFVGDSLYDDYQPLNESGLVIANPEEAPFQAYSWLAMPHGDNLLVESFDNFRGLDDTSMGAIGLDEVGFLPAEEQKELFGGTLAPTLKVQLDGTETRIVGELGDGQFLPSIGASYNQGRHSSNNRGRRSSNNRGRR